MKILIRIPEKAKISKYNIVAFIPEYYHGTVVYLLRLKARQCLKARIKTALRIKQRNNF